MAKDRMDVLELLRKMGTDVDIDFLREGLRMLVQAVNRAKSGQIGPLYGGSPLLITPGEMRAPEVGKRQKRAA